MKRILILKGGGVRGILQLDALRRIEDYYQKPLYQIFDLIVGTSVGAITGGILATGKFTAEEYAVFFIKYLPRIFKKYWWRGVLGPLYKRKPYYQMWRDFFGHERDTGKLLMNQCKTKFMCTSINICDSRTHFFKSWEPKDGKEELRVVIAKSFAAPYYFGQYADPKHQAIWIDGGTGDSNTPLDIAYAEAINLGWHKSPLDFVVIGTGTADYSIPYKKAKSRGELQQLLTFISPKHGGFARLQSTLNQIDRMHIIAQAEVLVIGDCPLLGLPLSVDLLPAKPDFVAFVDGRCCVRCSAGVVEISGNSRAHQRDCTVNGVTLIKELPDERPC